jgi:fructoselysine transporter
VIVTLLILCIAFSSLFAVVLGYSRVPYAAAVDGNFFRVFSKLHPKRQFPYVSLAALCAAGFAFSLLMKLADVITAILAMRIVVQFMSQCVGVVLLRKREGKAALPFKMWLYPLPVLVSLLIWAFLFYHTGLFAIYGLAIAAAGIIVFFLTHRKAPGQA